MQTKGKESKVEMPNELHRSVDDCDPVKLRGSRDCGMSKDKPFLSSTLLFLMRQCWNVQICILYTVCYILWIVACGKKVNWKASFYTKIVLCVLKAFRALLTPYMKWFLVMSHRSVLWKSQDGMLYTDGHLVLIGCVVKRKWFAIASPLVKMAFANWWLL